MKLPPEAFEAGDRLISIMTAVLADDSEALDGLVRQVADETDDVLLCGLVAGLVGFSHGMAKAFRSKVEPADWEEYRETLRRIATTFAQVER